MPWRVIVVVFLAVTLIAVLWQSQTRQGAVHVSGFIETDEIRLGSRVGGRVEHVLAQEGDFVKRGSTLVQLEAFQLKDLLAQAQAELSQREAVVSKLKSGFRDEEVLQAESNYRQWQATVEKLKRGPREEDIAVAVSQVELAEAELELAILKDARTEKLLTERAVSQVDRDQAVTERRVAQATVHARREELNKLKHGTRPEEIAEAEAQLEAIRQLWLLKKNGYRKEEISEAEAAVDAAKAACNAIERQMDELVIKAPIDGVVESLELQPGDLIGSNAPGVSILDVSNLWVRAYLPENRLNVGLGDEVRVTIDSYPNRDFKGRLSFLARQAEFTPGNVQTPEERSKQVFRIKVTLDPVDVPLHPGMSADIWLEPKRQ